MLSSPSSSSALYECFTITIIIPLCELWESEKTAFTTDQPLLTFNYNGLPLAFICRSCGVAVNVSDFRVSNLLNSLFKNITGHIFPGTGVLAISINTSSFYIAFRMNISCRYWVELPFVSTPCTLWVKNLFYDQRMLSLYRYIFSTRVVFANQEIKI